MAWLLVAALSASLAVAGDMSAQADSQPEDPSDPSTPVTVTADALPTAQINGVVWAQVVVGDVVYVGGSFSRARPAGVPAGTQDVVRTNLLAYNIDTGELVSSFAPTFNGQVRALAVSPDNSRLYVGGDFTRVNGVSRGRIAAFNTGTGSLVQGFAPALNGSVYDIVVTDATVFAGGSFRGVGGKIRNSLASFSSASGALKSWAPSATGGFVRALALSPDGSRMVVGGSFTRLNGSSKPGYGLGAVNASTGANLAFATNKLIRNAGPNAAITSLEGDGSYVYGSAYHFGPGGNLEGVFSSKWGGNLHWVDDCHGDTYSVQPIGGAVYVAGHTHQCTNIGAFPQTKPTSYYRAIAFGREVTGVARPEPAGTIYTNFGGKPTSSVLTWFPRLSLGTYTGQNQGPWQVTGNDTYVVMGGEFKSVNGTSQQGLVRFATSDVAPNEQPPRLFNATMPVAVRSWGDGTVRVSWGANYDYDNEYLTYDVYRDDQTAGARVHSRKVRAPFWNLPTMGYIDNHLEPGSTHRYRVVVTDPFGNAANSLWVSTTVPGNGALGGYARAVLNREPEYYWRMGESQGSTLVDTSGFGNGTARAGVTRGVPGALAGDLDTASRFSGTSSGFAATRKLESPPNVFSLEAWFKTTTKRGGKVIGFGNANTLASGPKRNDRNVYLDNAGHVRFGVSPRGIRTGVSSAATYRDGRWHQVVATLGPNGMALYVDGVRVAARTGVTFAQNGYWGYWRIGGDTLTGWPAAPVSPYLAGIIDEVAVYKSVLTAAEVTAHYNAGRTAVQ